MKAVLITLSGDAEIGRTILRQRYPQVEIIDVPREALAEGGVVDRVRKIRSTKPQIFAVMSESLSWQYGQDALMLFGAMTGAGASVLIDARGNVRSARRAELLISAPFAIAKAFRRGRSSVRRGIRRLDELENALLKDRRFQTNSSSPRIAYLRATPAAGTLPGGATSHINGVVNGLLALGAKIDLISNDEIAGLDKDKVAFQLIQPEPNVMPRTAFDIHNGMLFSDAAAQMIAASPPSFIYQRYCRFSWAGVEAGLRSGAPLLLEYNGSEVWIGKHWDQTEKLDLLERCEHLNLKAAAKIFVISEVERRNLLAGGVPDDKIIVNPNGVDTDEFRPDIGGREERAKLGVADDIVLVGFVGSFGPWHGVLALADAIAMTPKDANIHFLLIGDGSLRQEVERKLRDSGSSDRVTFTGVVKHDRVPALLDACDILVSPHVPLADGSEFFGSPTKLFEYMAIGKAIVASRLAQIGDVLKDNETAMLVEPGNARQLSDAISVLAADKKLRRRIGAAARQAAIDKHTWKQNAARVLEEYRR